MIFLQTIKQSYFPFITIVSISIVITYQLISINSVLNERYDQSLISEFENYMFDNLKFKNDITNYLETKMNISDGRKYENEIIDNLTDSFFDDLAKNNDYFSLAKYSLQSYLRSELKLTHIQSKVHSKAIVKIYAKHFKKFVKGEVVNHKIWFNTLITNFIKFVTTKWLSIIAFLFAIFSFVYFNKHRRPFYYILKTSIIYNQKIKFLSPEIKILKYDDTKLEDSLYLTEIVIGNNGRKDILKRNLVKNITLSFNDKHIKFILEPLFTIETNRESIAPKFEFISDQEMEFSFNILKYRDYFKFRVLYTVPSSIENPPKISVNWEVQDSKQLIEIIRFKFKNIASYISLNNVIFRAKNTNEIVSENYMHPEVMDNLYKVQDLIKQKYTKSNNKT